VSVGRLLLCGRLVVVVIGGAFGGVVVGVVRSLVVVLGAGLFWRVRGFGGGRAFCWCGRGSLSCWSVWSSHALFFGLTLSEHLSYSFYRGIFTGHQGENSRRKEKSSMAKLKAPLLSLGASGALGKAIVYMNWKGLDVVREYVIPANPKSTAQGIQRAYMIECVDMIHYCQGLAANPLVEADNMAYSLLGSLQPTPRTWFNTIVRQWLKQRVATLHPSIFHGGSAVGGSTNLTVTMQVSSPEVSVDEGYLAWGTSKSALVNFLACTKGELAAGKEITGRAPGVKLFVQFRSDLPIEQKGANSGIYYGVPTA